MRRDEQGNWTDFTAEDRDSCGKQYYEFWRISHPTGLGFLAPDYEKLPEDVRESYRAYGVTWVR